MDNNGKKCKDCNSYDGEWCWRLGEHKEKDDYCSQPDVINFSGETDEKS